MGYVALLFLVGITWAAITGGPCTHKTNQPTKRNIDLDALLKDVEPVSKPKGSRKAVKPIKVSNASVSKKQKKHKKKHGVASEAPQVNTRSLPNEPESKPVKTKRQAVQPLVIGKSKAVKPRVSTGAKSKVEALAIERLSNVEPTVVYEDGRIPLDLDTVMPEGKFYVYQIQVGTDYYVGFTSRSFDVRIEEHLNCARNKDQTLLYSKLREQSYEYKLVSLTEYDSELAALNGEREGIRTTPTAFRLNLTPGGEGHRFNVFKDNGKLFYTEKE